MDFNSIYNDIIAKWRLTGYIHIINDLEQSSRGAATGGEGIAMIGKFLKDLKIKNYDAYQIVEDLISEYLVLCSKSGMQIK